MLILSPQTAASLGPLTRGTSGVIFVQAQIGAGQAPIKIEGTSDPATRLREIDREYPVITYWVGWFPSETPRPLATAIGEQHRAAHLRGDWYTPTLELLAYIQHVAQRPLFELLSQLKQHSHPEGTMTLKELASYLGCSESTIRRMVEREEIPALRIGRQLRFFPADVVANLQRRGQLR